MIEARLTLDEFLGAELVAPLPAVAPEISPSMTKEERSLKTVLFFGWYERESMKLGGNMPVLLA